MFLKIPAIPPKMGDRDLYKHMIGEMR